MKAKAKRRWLLIEPAIWPSTVVC